MPARIPLWDKINKNGPVSTDPLSTVTTNCWLWTKGVNRGGYGHCRLNGRQGNAHRLVYEDQVGSLPEGTELDHRCRVRLCVRPDHMVPRTRKDHIHQSPLTVGSRNSAKTHCDQGHEFTKANTYTRPGSARRECRTCRNTASREYKKRSR